VRLKDTVLLIVPLLVIPVRWSVTEAVLRVTAATMLKPAPSSVAPASMLTYDIATRVPTCRMRE
jgi:hypothetical protein